MESVIHDRNVYMTAAIKAAATGVAPCCRPEVWRCLWLCCSGQAGQACCHLLQASARPPGGHLGPGCLWLCFGSAGWKLPHADHALCAGRPASPALVYDEGREGHHLWRYLMPEGGPQGSSWLGAGEGTYQPLEVRARAWADCGCLVEQAGQLSGGSRRMLPAELPARWELLHTPQRMGWQQRACGDARLPAGAAACGRPGGLCTRAWHAARVGQAAGRQQDAGRA